MLSIKSFFVMWLFSCTISEIYSSDYLRFGGTENESKEAEYYLSADSGTNTSPTDELIRTQRSLWDLLKQGLYGNCCNNCNYNIKSSPFLPLQPWRPLPIWQPLKPLFSGANYDNYGKCNYADVDGNSTSHGTHINTYSDKGIDSSSSVPSAPESVYQTSTELPPEKPGYKQHNNAVTENTYEPPSKPAVTENNYNAPEYSTYINDETSKGPQHSNRIVPQILYQPIIYVSPPYQGNKALIQNKRYGEEPKEHEKPQLPNYEMLSDDEHKQHKTISNGIYNYVQKVSEKETGIGVSPCTQTVPFSEAMVPNTVNPPTNPSVSTVSTVYNIITPSLPHSLVASQDIKSSKGAPSLCSSNYIDNYSLATPTKIGFSPNMSPADRPPVSFYANPIRLTADDQPYRQCPELFREYQHKLNMWLTHTHSIGVDSSFANAQQNC